MLLICCSCAGDAKQVEDAEVWVELLKLLEDPETLKTFFKDYCESDVVQPPVTQLYEDAMSLDPAARQGKLLVCRDKSGHDGAAVQCVSLKTLLYRLTMMELSRSSGIWPRLASSRSHVSNITCNHNKRNHGIIAGDTQKDLLFINGRCKRLEVALRAQHGMPCVRPMRSHQLLIAQLFIASSHV
jgi:hypothetical protein